VDERETKEIKTKQDREREKEALKSNEMNVEHLQL
jgi:hypothetical protein